MNGEYSDDWESHLGINGDIELPEYVLKEISALNPSRDFRRLCQLAFSEYDFLRKFRINEGNKERRRRKAEQILNRAEKLHFELQDLDDFTLTDDIGSPILTNVPGADMDALINIAELARNTLSALQADSGRVTKQSELTTLIFILENSFDKHEVPRSKLSEFVAQCLCVMYKDAPDKRTIEKQVSLANVTRKK